LPAVLLALSASLAWGVADFVGPLQGRRFGALAVLLVAQLGGLAAIALVVLASGRGPRGADVLFAIPAACSGVLGLYAYYRGMVVGAISVVAPVAGISAAIPVLVGLASGDRPSALQLVGMAVALAGVGLAAREPGGGERRVAAGVGLALLAAVGFGFYFPPMHIAGEADFLWASLLFRATATLVIATVALAARPRFPFGRRSVVIIALVGVGDTLGNVLFAASAAHGLVSVTSVLASLYPVVTVILAHLFLSERVSTGQRLGVAGTLAGVTLISAG
jgi:drug/metabolite transporter (DMT)-like permease